MAMEFGEDFETGHPFHAPRVLRVAVDFDGGVPQHHYASVEHPGIGDTTSAGYSGHVGETVQGIPAAAHLLTRFRATAPFPEGAGRVSQPVTV